MLMYLLSLSFMPQMFPISWLFIYVLTNFMFLMSICSWYVFYPDIKSFTSNSINLNSFKKFSTSYFLFSGKF